MIEEKGKKNCKKKERKKTSHLITIRIYKIEFKNIYKSDVNETYKNIRVKIRGIQEINLKCEKQSK